MDIDTISPILTWIIGSAVGIGVIVAGVGYGYGQFKKGTKNVDEETIISLQRQIKTFKEELDEVKANNKELEAKYNRAQGQLQTYKEIALNKNPEVLKVLQLLSEILPRLVGSVEYCQTHNKGLAEEMNKNTKRNKSNELHIEALENA